jgi:glyoxylase-like metal-dependent hydrolase (beta-lactamase superfamily II)
MRIKPYVVGSIGTNCYLVWDEVSREALLIDPGDHAPEIQNEIESEKLSLKYIVLTHCHFDHILGIEEFIGSNPDAKLAGSAADESMLDGLKIDRKLEDGCSIGLGELRFSVLSTPGHTYGGISIYIPECDLNLVGKSFSGTVFTGDTLFQTSVGRTDLHGGDFGVLASSIKEKLFTLPDDTLVLPGHMGATTIGHEKKYNPFVK